jgi:hypothetical protein
MLRYLGGDINIFSIEISSSSFGETRIEIKMPSQLRRKGIVLRTGIPTGRETAYLAAVPPEGSASKNFATWAGSKDNYVF